MVVPQGSVPGTLLWNIFYDRVLEVRLPEGCDVVAYADDLALLAVVTKVEMMRARGEDYLKVIGA